MPVGHGPRGGREASRLEGCPLLAPVLPPEQVGSAAAPTAIPTILCQFVYK